jgi:asparagine synthase (glutamine-hydrolysing)
VKINRRIKTLKSLYRHFGARWVLFRIGYAVRMRTGIMRWQIPSYHWKDRPLRYWVKSQIPSDPEAYRTYRKENQPDFFFDSINFPQKNSWDQIEVVKEADHYLAGITRYFSKTDYQTGFPPDWLLDPFRNIRLLADKHWSQIPDDGPYDIKFIWEASRLSQVYTLVRAYARTQDENYPAAFWQVVEDWMQENPPGMGPNWKCGQEATLRLMALCFGYYAFKDQPQSTSERVSQLTILAAALAERIYMNLGYAIYTRSNHTISESFGVWLAGILFPELKNAKKYRKLGQQILEKEASTQIYPDGSYAMHSLNYHRFILHIYLFAMRIAEVNYQKFSLSVYQAVERSIEYLYTLIDLQTGQMPQYGSNDGALVLPLNSCDYMDYRPLIQLGYYTLHKQRIFPPGGWDEDLFWFYGKEALDSSLETKSQPTDELFLDGGITKISGEQTRAFIRCGPIRDRPSHADQNHMDIWWQGKNIAMDPGTFLYSGDGHWRNGLASTRVHNTVTVDEQDQMEKFSRFIWVDWSQGDILAFEYKKGLIFWQGQQNGYTRLKDPVMHKRTVILLDNTNWFVVDHLQGELDHQFMLNWSLCHDFLQLKNTENTLQLKYKSRTLNAQFGLLGKHTPIDVVSADETSERGWVSRYYGHKKPAISVQLTTQNKQALFWSFFGTASHKPVDNGDDFSIHSKTWHLHLNPMQITIKQADQHQETILNIQANQSSS